MKGCISDYTCVKVTILVFFVTGSNSDSNPHPWSQASNRHHRNHKYNIAVAKWFVFHMLSALVPQPQTYENSYYYRYFNYRLDKIVARLICHAKPSLRIPYINV